MLTEKLRYFLTIAEYRNITKAAESLFIAQPSLSKYLKCLEADLGVRLFARTLPLTLTPAGEKYYKFAQNVVLEEKKLNAELFALSHNSQSLRVGIPVWRYSLLLPKLLPLVLRQLPNYDIQVKEIFGFEEDYFALLEKDEIDCCVCIPPVKLDSKYYAYPIYKEKYLLIGNKEHPAVRKALSEPEPSLHGRYQYFDIRNLNGETVINYKPGQSMEEHFRTELERNKVSPKGIITTTNVITAINMTRAHQSFSIIPELGERLSPLPSNVACFVIGNPIFTCDFSAIALSCYAQTEILQDFFKIMSYKINEICASNNTFR